MSRVSVVWGRGAAARAPLRVNPGYQVVVARAGGRELKREVDAHEGQTSAVELVFSGDAAPVPSLNRDSVEIARACNASRSRAGWLR